MASHDAAQDGMPGDLWGYRLAHRRRYGRPESALLAQWSSCVRSHARVWRHPYVAGTWSASGVAAPAWLDGVGPSSGALARRLRSR
jgi:hypothetical protein